MEIILQGNSAEVLFIIAIIVVTQTKLPALLCTCNSVKFHSEMLLKKKINISLRHFANSPCSGMFKLFECDKTQFILQHDVSERFYLVTDFLNFTV